MLSARPARCEFCGATIGEASPARGGARRPRCAGCEALAEPLFLVDSPHEGVREVMINQHPGEPARKQLELPGHTVVVFLDARRDILGLEIETRSRDRLLRWSTASGSGRFRVHNIGRSYGNRDELLKEDGFDHLRLRRDIAAVRHLLRPGVLAALDTAAAG